MSQEQTKDIQAFVFRRKAFLLPFLLFVFALFFVFNAGFLSAQNGEIECQTMEECKELLARYEKEVSDWEIKIEKTQQEKNTLANKISSLKQKISKLDVEIKKSNVMIKDLNLQIKDTGESITETEKQVGEQREQLAALLRVIASEDKKTITEIFLAEDTIASFFRNMVALEKINVRTYETLNKIKDLKLSLEEQKDKMEGEKDDLEKVLIITKLQKEEASKIKTEQEVVLKETKGREEVYQQNLAITKQKAAEIRTRIFDIIGVAEAPTFGEAVEMAKFVSSLTGVRPAFLLAVLTQESNIGKNVGQCYLKDSKTGAGTKITSGNSVSKVMNPKRDVPYFLQITKELGVNSYETPVSCPMSFGWGGAMGPAQFIPATWALYKDRLEKILGYKANPWKVKDAFMAAALYLSDYGAKKQNYTAEWKAAMIYFSGSTNARYRFYGDSVIALTKKYEKEIEAIEQY
ncbi:MAG: lytic murein transglycosylase [bacterium]|nr:lytic murein transglycosylase [bacterium]